LSDAKTLYEEGTVLFEAADYRGALDKFTAALAIVKREGGEDQTRLALLYNIARTHEKQFEIDKDVTHLRQALALYRQYEDFTETQGDLGEELDIHSKVLDLERRLRIHDDMERNRAAAATGARDVPPPPSSASDDGWKRPRNVGIGLLIPGSAAVVGGVVMLVAGSRFEPRAQAQVNELADLGVPMDHPAWAEGDKFIEQERRKGVLFMGLGGSLAVVGALGVGVGSFYLVKSKRAREKNLSFVPAIGRGFAGVQLSGSF
jgi:tetratricopeptide (TPR) repeat protein